MTTAQQRVRNLLKLTAEVRELEQQQDQKLQEILKQMESIKRGLEEVENLLNE